MTLPSSVRSHSPPLFKKELTNLLFAKFRAGVCPILCIDYVELKSTKLIITGDADGVLKIWADHELCLKINLKQYYAGKSKEDDKLYVNLVKFVPSSCSDVGVIGFCTNIGLIDLLISKDANSKYVLKEKPKIIKIDHEFTFCKSIALYNTKDQNTYIAIPVQERNISLIKYKSNDEKSLVLLEKIVADKEKGYLLCLLLKEIENESNYLLFSGYESGIVTTHRFKPQTNNTKAQTDKKNPLMVEHLKEIKLYDSPVACIAFDYTQNMLYAGNYNMEITSICLDFGYTKCLKIKTVSTNVQNINDLAYSEELKILFCASSNSNIMGYSRKGLRNIISLENKKSKNVLVKTFECKLPENSCCVAGASDEGSVFLWVVSSKETKM